MIVPDAIEPVMGWRAWIYWPRFVPDKPAVLSLTNYEMVWQPGEPMVARCPNGWHEPPGPGLWYADDPKDRCSCGVHALASPHAGRWPFGDPELYRSPDTVGLIGRVALWGRVIEGEYGWRAQYAYPQEFVVLERDDWRLPHPDDEVNPWDHLREFGVPISFAGTRDMRAALDALSLQEAA